MRRTKKQSLRRGVQAVLVVAGLAVVGLLGAGLVMPSCGGGSFKLPRVESDFESLHRSLKGFHNTHSRYPTEEEGLRILVANGEGSHALPDWQPYCIDVPRDPWGQAYRYTVDFTPGAGSRISKTKGEAYRLISAGADGEFGGPDDLTRDFDVNGVVE